MEKDNGRKLRMIIFQPGRWMWICGYVDVDILLSLTVAIYNIFFASLRLISLSMCASIISFHLLSIISLSFFLSFLYTHMHSLSPSLSFSLLSHPERPCKSEHARRPPSNCTVMMAA